MIKRIAIFILVAVGLFGFTQPARAANVAWLGTTDELWSTDANWDGGSPPEADDQAVFNATDNPCTIDENVSIRGIIISGTYSETITVDSNVTITLPHQFNMSTTGGATFDASDSTCNLDIAEFYMSNNGTFIAPAALDDTSFKIKYIFQTESTNTFIHSSGRLVMYCDEEMDCFVINTTGDNFYDITFTIPSGIYYGAANIIADHDVTITAGMLDMSTEAKALQAGGNLTLTGGELSANNASCYIEVSGDVSASGTSVINAPPVSGLCFSVLGSWSITEDASFSDNNGNITFSGSGSHTITTSSSAADDFYDVTFNPSGGTWTLQDPLQIDHDFSIDTATVDLNGQNLTLDASSTFTNAGTLKLKGSEALTNFTNDTTAGIVYYNGTGDYTSTPGKLAAGDDYYHLTFNGSGGQWILNSALDVDGNFTLTAGTLSTSGTNYAVDIAGDLDIDGALTANGSTITVGGDWDSSGGTFTKGTSEVVLSGAGDLAVPAGNGFVGIFDTLTVNGTYSVTTTSWLMGLMDTNRVLTLGDSATLNVAEGVTADVGNASFTMNDNSTLGGSGTFEYSVYYADVISSITWSETGTAISVGTFKYNGSSSDSTIPAFTYGGNLHVLNTVGSTAWSPKLGSGTLTVGGDLKVYEDSSGRTTTLDNSVNSTPISVAGSIDFKNGQSGNGAYTCGAETVTLNGTGDQDITSNGSPFYNLTLSNTGDPGSDDITLQDALDVNNNLTISDGDLNGNNKGITIGKDWDNSGSGSYTKGTETVTFDTAANVSTIKGSTTFQGFSCTTGGKELDFTAGTTQTVAGALTLSGSSGSLLTLRSTTNGSAWNLNNSGTNSITYVDVQDSNASTGNEIDASDGTCMDSLNNTNWNFGATTSHSIFFGVNF